VRRADNLTIFTCRLSRNLGASTSWNPKDLSRPVMGLLYLFTLPLCFISDSYDLCTRTTRADWHTLRNFIRGKRPLGRQVHSGRLLKRILQKQIRSHWPNGLWYIPSPIARPPRPLVPSPNTPPLRSLVRTGPANMAT
jgi:hypothetical protein